MRGEIKVKQIKKLFWLYFIVFLFIIPITSPQAGQQPEDPEEEETVLVGRISHVEGQQLLRYVPEGKEWVATVRDAPFYVDDVLYSDKKGKAEFILPNNTWVRIDGDTQIQLNALKEDETEIDVAFGVVRFHNKGLYSVIKATTPFGYVMASEETIFDLYVGEESLEIIALKGRLDFFHNTSETRYEVIAGAASILADSGQVTAGKGSVDPDWERWNCDRENLWAARSRTGGESAKYLPPGLWYEAYTLEEHGRWERVYYDGGYWYFWRPVYVSVGWAPFTAGRWTVCYGENVWIPCEPFGYVTHHYGNWLFIRGFWYWAPPVARVRVRVGPPLFNIGFFWYPGRVAWIHAGVYIGWVPLAPYEPYYCYRRWGPRAVVVTKVDVAHVNINRYTYLKHAVIINKSKLYAVENYRRVKVRNINHARLASNYHVAHVLNDTVIKNYKNIRQKDDFTNVHVRQRLPRPDVQTIRPRPVTSKQRVDIKTKVTRPNIADTRPGPDAERAHVRSRESKDRLTPTNPLHRPMAEAKFRDEGHEQKGSFGTQDRMETKKEVKKVLGRIPLNSVKRQKVRAEDQRSARRDVKKVQRQKGSSPRTVSRQEGQLEDQRRAGNVTTQVRRTILPKAAEQVQPAGRRQQSRQGEGRRKTRSNPKPQQWQPGQEKNRRDGGREENIVGRTLQPDVPASPGAASPRSQLHFAKDRSPKKQMNNRGQLFPGSRLNFQRGSAHY